MNRLSVVKVREEKKKITRVAAPYHAAGDIKLTKKGNIRVARLGKQKKTNL